MRAGGGGGWGRDEEAHHSVELDEDTTSGRLYVLAVIPILSWMNGVRFCVIIIIAAPGQSIESIDAYVCEDAFECLGVTTYRLGDSGKLGRRGYRISRARPQNGAQGG